MRARVLISAAAVAVLGVVLAGVSPAGAADTGGENTFANAQASGGQLTVQAGVTHWTPPSGSAWAKQADSDPPPGKPNPNQPYGCTYTAAPSLTAAIGAGGAQPGEWMDAECAGPGVIDPMPPIWVSDATQAAAQIDPAVVAEQAVKQLAFGSPSDRDGPTGREPAVGLGGNVAVARPGRLADPDRHGERRHGDGHRDGDALEGGVGHGRRRQRDL